jgi:hypothetical protein
MAPQMACAISRICIYPDMTKPGSPVFPIGYVAELVTPDARILGLVGRERLEPMELAALHGLLRHHASDLWEWLVSEFNLAAGMEPGKSLDYLAARHSYSFSVEKPKSVPLPQSVIDAAQKGKESLKNEFRAFLLEHARAGLNQYETGIRAQFAA